MRIPNYVVSFGHGLISIMRGNKCIYEDKATPERLDSMRQYIGNTLSPSTPYPVSEDTARKLHGNFTQQTETIH